MSRSFRRPGGAADIATSRFDSWRFFRQQPGADQYVSKLTVRQGRRLRGDYAAFKSGRAAPASPASPRSSGHASCCCTGLTCAAAPVWHPLSWLHHVELAVLSAEAPRRRPAPSSPQPWTAGSQIHAMLAIYEAAEAACRAVRGRPGRCTSGPTPGTASTAVVSRHSQGWRACATDTRCWHENKKTDLRDSPETFATSTFRAPQTWSHAVPAFVRALMPASWCMKCLRLKADVNVTLYSFQISLSDRPEHAASPEPVSDQVVQHIECVSRLSKPRDGGRCRER